MNIPESKHRIKDSLLNGQKLEAVKELKSLFNLSLAEANKLAEELSDLSGFEKVWEEKTQSLNTDHHSETGNPSEKIKSLLLQRRKLEAVKFLKEITNSGLKEAKDTVDQMEMQLIESGQIVPDKKSPIIRLIIFIILLAAFAYFFFS